MALPDVKVRVTGDAAGAKHALDDVNSKLATASNRAKGYSKHINRAAAHTGNLTAQLNDIGVMLAAGQSPLTLAMQQGTQVNQVLGQMGTTGKDRIRAVGTALMSAISPANLFTLGIIAGGAALFQFAFSAGEASDELEGLEKVLKDIEDQAISAERRLLAFRFGVFDAEQAEVFERINQLREERVIIEGKIAATEAAGVTRGAVALDNHRESLALVDEELSRLQEVIQRERTANSELERQRELRRDMLRRAGDLSEAEREIWTTQQNISKEAENLTSELGMAATRALVLAGVDITSPIASATKEAAALAENLGISLNAALSLQNLRSSIDYGGRGGDPRGFGDPFSRNPDESSGNLQPSTLDLINTGRGRSGGSGGGGGSRTSPVEQLVEELKTEREILSEWYAESLELLTSAGDQELEVLGGHNEARLRLEEEYQERLKGIRDSSNSTALGDAGKFFGEMASAFGRGNDKMLKIAKVFGAAQALISAYQGAAEALKLPYPQNLAAYAQVLAQGLSAVSAIRGVSASGGGGSGGAGAAPAAAAPSNDLFANINLVGNGPFGKDDVRGLIEQLNEAIDDGAVLRSITVS